MTSATTAHTYDSVSKLALEVTSATRAQSRATERYIRNESPDRSDVDAADARQEAAQEALWAALWHLTDGRSA